MDEWENSNRVSLSKFHTKFFFVGFFISLARILLILFALEYELKYKVCQIRKRNYWWEI